MKNFMMSLLVLAFSGISSAATLASYEFGVRSDTVDQFNFFAVEIDDNGTAAISKEVVTGSYRHVPGPATQYSLILTDVQKADIEEQIARVESTKRLKVLLKALTEGLN